IIRAIDWSALCVSRRFRQDGARRSRHCCKAKRLVREPAIRPKTRRSAMNTTSTAVVKLSIEVITLPVGDVERALRSTSIKSASHSTSTIRQTTRSASYSSLRRGSSCSIQIGRGLTDARVGSLRNVYLVVTNLEAARNRLLERGVEVGEIRHKA